jgi:CubicO group peptidase (beta-lactamase class C family)
MSDERTRIGSLVPEVGNDDPGLLVAVVHRSRIAASYVAGAANLDTGEPLRADSIFYVGSLAKQFVAACVALLWREGALELSDPINRFVDGLPAWAGPITLQHLLHHTGGLPNAYRPAGGIGPGGVPGWGDDDLLEEVRKLPEPLAAPGDAHVYAGDGYLLLGRAVASASGSSLAAFARQHIFEPLGMADTFFRDTEAALPDRAARGHFRATDGRLHIEPARFHAVGSGGLWTTAEDLARWDANFDDDRLAGGWLSETLTTRGSLADGRPIHYAWGVSIRTHRGLAIQSHGGSFPGWESKMVRFPVHGTTVLCLANSQELDVSSLTFAVADTVLAEDIDSTAPHANDSFER